MVNIGSYMFRHLGDILRESAGTKDEGHQKLNWRIELEYLCPNRLSAEDATPVQQHVVVDNYH
jgi:hypothetical protein